MRPSPKHSFWLGIRTTALAGSLMLTAGCQLRLALWIMPGSRAQDLVFGISEHRNGTEPVRLSSLRVFRCADIEERGELGSYPCPGKEVWNVASIDSDHIPSITRIVYGQTPGGLHASSPAGLLERPGCYVVLAYAFDSRGDQRAATVGFRVLGNGSVEEMSRGDYDRVFARGKAT